MTRNATHHLLFVCTGNICRSPIARFLAEHRAREAGLPWNAASAGVAADVGAGMTAGALRALESRGIDGRSHVARQLNEEMLSWADQVYAMTHAHRDTIIARAPAHAAKVVVLRAAAGLPDHDVDDPFGQSDRVYNECAARIEEALALLIRRNSRVENHR